MEENSTGNQWKCGGIKILNHQNGDTIKYPLVLLEGFVTTSASADSVGEPELKHPAISRETSCSNQKEDPHKDERILVECQQNCASWPIICGGFKALVPLSTGENTVKLKCTQGKSICELEYKLNYQQPDIKRFVRVVYIKCQDADGSFDAPEGVANDINTAIKKLKLNVQLLQTFTAENLFQHGLGHGTFRVEQEEDGSPKVHIFTSTLKTSEALGMTGGELYDKFSTELSASDLHNPLCKWWVFMSCTHYDPPPEAEFQESNITQYVKAHTALGGGQLALFGTGCLHTWAGDISEITNCFTDVTVIDKRKLFDDSCGRGAYWANYATTLGASMHELGHCFDLAHTPGGIMGRGFDDMNCVFTLWRKPPVADGTQEERMCTGPNVDELVERRKVKESVGEISLTPSPLVTPTPAAQVTSVQQKEGQTPTALSRPGDWSHGATWYRSSAVVLKYHKWFLEGEDEEEQTCLPVVHWRSDVCGPVGNFGGCYQQNQISFSDEKWLKSRNASLAGFSVQADEYVNCIQTLGTIHGSSEGGGKCLSLLCCAVRDSTRQDEAEQVRSEERGRSGAGRAQTFLFTDPDEYLARVDVRAGAWVDAIRFHSNKRSSEWMGGSGGDLYRLTPPPGKQITGLFGTAEHYLGSIGLQLSRVDNEESLMEPDSMAIRSPHGLRLIELRDKQHDQVCKHWEFLDQDPPSTFFIPRTEITEKDCGGIMIEDNKGIILRVGTLYDYSDALEKTLLQ